MLITSDKIPANKHNVIQSPFVTLAFDTIGDKTVFDMRTV